MITLGISFGYHDASVAIVKDNEVIYSSAEQHFTRQKHDSSFPRYAIESGMRMFGLAAKDLDKVVYHEDPYSKFSRILSSVFSSYPYSQKEFVDVSKTWLGKRLLVFKEISDNLQVPSRKIAYLNHHLSHAANAFLLSGFEQSACAVIDAVGDWSCSAFYDCAWLDGAPVIKKIDDVQFPVSLGLIYSAFTSFLGFQPNSDENSVMALASFGEPIYLNEIEKLIIKNLKTTKISLNEEYLNFSTFYSSPYTKKFKSVFGQPRKIFDKVPFSCLQENKNEKLVSEEHKRFANIAASVQKFFEQETMNYFVKLKEQTGRDKVVFAGGAALNCVNNSKLKNDARFSSMFIPPDPGDGGSSIGVALYYNLLNKKSAGPKALKTPYLGSAMNSKSIQQITPFISSKKISKYSKHGWEGKINANWRVTEFKSKEEGYRIVAQKIFNNHIVGWVQGRNEVGPRALGNRSIIIKADSLKLAQRLSCEVKDRAQFRPYALAMTEQSARQILDLKDDANGLQSYKWMQYAVNVKQEHRGRVCGGVHIDGTTRPQICFKEDNPDFYGLLTAYEEISGELTAVINTSFNESGFPIVGMAVDALTVFARTSLDCLVVENILFEKE